MIRYYRTISALYKALVEKEIRDDVGIIKNIGKITELIDSLEKTI